MDYTIFCRRLYASFGLPSVLFSGKTFVYSTLSELLGYTPAKNYPVEALSINPYVVAARETIIYGMLDVEGGDEHLIIGPVFNVPVNNAILDMFLADHKIPEQYRRQLLRLLKAIPVTSFRQMQQQMTLFHFCLNGKETDNRNHYQPLDREIAFQSNEEHFTQMLQKRDEDVQENTYYSDLALCKLIQAGDTDGLDRYVRQNAISFQTGQLATSSLRQAKNTFITTVTKIAMLVKLPEISIRSGFCSQSHFQNNFKKAFGTTPSAYRRDERKFRYFD